MTFFRYFSGHLFRHFVAFQTVSHKMFVFVIKVMLNLSALVNFTFETWRNLWKTLWTQSRICTLLSSEWKLRYSSNETTRKYFYKILRTIRQGSVLQNISNHTTRKCFYKIVRTMRRGNAFPLELENRMNRSKTSKT